MAIQLEESTMYTHVLLPELSISSPPVIDFAI